MSVPIPLDFTMPIPRIDGRTPVRTQEFKPGTHPGLDLGYVWREGDPTDPAHRSGGGKGAYVLLEGTPQLCPTAGEVVYSEWRKRGWATRIRTAHGFDVCLFHGINGTGRVKPGQKLAAGDVVALVGADPLDGEGWRHLHFEVRIPSSGENQDGYGYVPIDPWPLIRVARVAEYVIPD